MARIRYNHNSFSIGILSKKVQGNTDLEGYNNALDKCVNFQIQHTGGLFKRGGSYFVAETFNNEEAELILFSYSAKDTYVCEFTDQYVRFFTKYGILKRPDNTDVELDTELTLDDIRETKTFQDGNILNLVTPKGIYQLKRVETTEFTIEKKDAYTSMPLSFMNTENIGLKPDKDSGDIVITAVNPKEPANKPNLKFAPVFYGTDVNNYLVLTYAFIDGKTRIYYLKINSAPDDAGGFRGLICIIDKERCVDPVLTEDGTPKLPNLDCVTRWQISAFTEDRGIPKASTVYEGRLFLANNAPSYPTGIWGSSLMYDDMFDFYTGSNAADAVQFKVNMQQADDLLWLAGQSKLFAGTKSGIYIAGAASYNDEAITPANFRVRLLEAVGASPLQPLVALNSVFFVDYSEKNVHEIVLSTESGAYQVNDVSLLANELTQSGIVAHTWQQTPIKTYWCAVKDGYLCALTYLKNNGILAWSKHVIAGNNVKVSSLCTIYGDKSDLVFMVVQRENNGEIKRYIEYLHPMYDPLGQEEFKQFYVDSGITKQIKYTIADIQKSENTHITTAVPKSVLGMDETMVIFKSEMPPANHLFAKKEPFLAKNITADGFDLYDDFRMYNNPKIQYGKINHRNYSDSNLTGNAEIFYKIGNITGVEVGDKIFVKCSDTSALSEGDEIIITQSGISKNGIDIVDFEKTKESFKVGHITAEGFALYSINNVPISADNFSLGKYPEVFKLGDVVAELNMGTNTKIELQTPINEPLCENVYINKVYGMTQINNKKYKILWTSDDKKEIEVYDSSASPSEKDIDVPLDSNNFFHYDNTVSNNGNVYLYFNQVDGLDHLEGQEVAICSNGNTATPKVVKNGTIDLNHNSMYCSVGLPMKAYMQTVPFAGGNVLGSSVGSVGSQKAMYLSLYHSLAGKYGSEQNNIFKIPYPSNTNLNKPKNLVIGLVKCPMINSSVPTDRSVYIEHEDPLSFNILSLTQDIQVSDA